MPQSNASYKGYGKLRTLFFTLLTVFSVFYSAYADNIDDQLKTIASSHEWDVLLHYERGWLSTRSLVDDPSFFISPDGKYDKYAEIKAFYNAVYVNKVEGNDYAACKFPARATFLAKSLGLPVIDLHLSDCKDFQNFMLYVNPSKVSIIFPFYHMNSPASMFGHTLLRFDSDNNAKLASMAVTYAADFDKKDNGIAYAIKGAAGLYQGHTQILPYHEKIREYDNINQRDIWEYQLKMTRDEVRTMAMHAYEMQNVWSKYYFFDENCSYNLLFLIEAARPDTRLTEDFLWVIPVDTVAVLKKKGLIGDATYRPSQTHRMTWMLKHMEETVYEIAIKSMKDNKLEDYSALTENQKIELLDFWSEYTMFSNRYNKDNKKYSTDLISVLRQRAKIPAVINYDIPVPPEPLTGHSPSRIKISGGSDGGKFFEDINWKPALHTLDDSDIGYLPGSSLSFFDITFRHDQNKTYLKKLSLVDIYSLSPVDELFSPLSWKVSFGLEHTDHDDGTAAFFSPGAGKAFNVYGGLLYGLFMTKLQASGGYNDFYSAGVGYQTGYLKQVKNVKVDLSADFMRFGAGELHKEGHFNGTLGVFMSKNTSLDANVIRSYYGGTEASAGFSLFY